MKLTTIQARNKIREHLNQGNGIYIDGRYFDVRVKDGVLQVSDFNSWFDVKEGAEFRNSHGRTLFTYEQEVTPAKHWILTRDRMETMVEKLDRNEITLKYAKEYYFGYGVDIKARSKAEFIKALADLVNG